MRFSIKIFFTIIMSLFVVLSTNSTSVFAMEVNSETMSCDEMRLDSCCNQKKKTENNCNHCSKEGNNKCGNVCSTSCCCVNFFIFNEEIQQYNFLPLRIYCNSIDTYKEQYAYLFQSNIYKPPITLSI